MLNAQSPIYINAGTTNPGGQLVRHLPGTQVCLSPSMGTVFGNWDCIKETEQFVLTYHRMAMQQKVCGRGSAFKNS